LPRHAIHIRSVSVKMKFLAIASLLASALAAPQAAPADAQWMILTVQSSKEGSAINNNFLSQQGDTFGLYANARADASQAARMFPEPYEKTYSLHVKDKTHQVCLLGTKGSGLLELVDRVNPTGASIPEGKIQEWSYWVIDGQGKLGVADTNVDHTARHWIAWEKSEGTYSVALYDGVTLPLPANYENVTIIAAGAPK